MATGLNPFRFEIGQDVEVFEGFYKGRTGTASELALTAKGCNVVVKPYSNDTKGPCRVPQSMVRPYCPF